MNTIIVSEYVSLNQGVTPSEGEPIRARIYSSLKSNTPIVLDFKDIQLITTAFLNIAIGTLYKDFQSTELQRLLTFANLTPDIATRIKKVTNNAKLFYENPQQFEQNVDSALYGKN